MQRFGDVFEKNIDVDVFDDVLQNAKHHANDASNDVDRPPLPSSEQKGADMFQRARRTKKQAAGRGTSRYPNWIKS